MREFLKKKKVFILMLALVVGILGTTSTMAVLSASTGSIINIFKPADVNTHIEEEEDDQPLKANTNILKIPVVVNDGPSNAFIRARITISPSTSSVKLYAGSWSTLTGATKMFTQSQVVYDGSTFYNNGNWIYNSADGFYYYNLPVKAGDATASIFDAVVLKESADVTIYQESVLATDNYSLGVAAEVSKIEALFDRVDK